MLRGVIQGNDVKTFSYQVFHLLFGDEFQTMPLILMNIFKGTLKRSFETTDFIDHSHPEILQLKHLILKSGRLAFHYALECFIMGEVEPGEYRSFEVRIIVFV